MNAPYTQHDKDGDDHQQTDERCILCEAVIEIGDHEIYFATGRCRYCHEAAESEDNK